MKIPLDIESQLERLAIQAEAEEGDRVDAAEQSIRRLDPYLAEATPPLPDKIQALVPDDGYISDYVRWAYPLTDAPVEYHLAGAMSALSVAVGNRVWIPSGPLRLYLNIWEVIIGDSSYFRKTTCLNFSQKLIRAACPDRVLSEDTTPQTLYKKFGDEPNRVILASEFADLLESLAIDYNKGLKQKFANLFDVPQHFDKERATEENSRRVEYPYLCILAATAPEWLKLNEEDLRGGFYSRFVFVKADSKRGRFIARQPKPDINVEQGLIGHLQAVSRCPSSEVDTSEIDSSYEDWQRRHVSECDDFQRPDLLSSFWTRLESYCLKFAALYHLARTPVTNVGGAMVLLDQDIEYGIRLTEFHKAQIIGLLSNTFTFTRSGEVRQKLARLIGQKPGMTMRDLKTWGHFDARDNVDGELSFPISTGVVRFKDDKAKNGRNIREFRLREAKQ